MASKDPQRPNVLFIISDDQGTWALGCGGNREIRTPVFDRLAEGGVRFDNFFCASPVGSPARASLLTGDIPSRHGVHDWIRVGSMGESRIDYLAGQTLIHDVAPSRDSPEAADGGLVRKSGHGDAVDTVAERAAVIVGARV